MLMTLVKRLLLEYWQQELEDPPFLNVGTGNDLTIRELAEKIAEVVGFQGEIKWNTNFPDGSPKKQLDVSRLKSMGWKASISLDQGLALAYQNFQEALVADSLRI